MCTCAQTQRRRWVIFKHGHNEAAASKMPAHKCKGTLALRCVSAGLAPKSQWPLTPGTLGASLASI